MPTPDPMAAGRLNNFTLVRICAALAVMISHAYPLATGDARSEPLLDTGLTLGEQALMAFFAISGFLVAKSFSRAPDLVPFVTARALRIMPAYLVLLALTVGVLGPWVTALPVGQYLRAPETLAYGGANGAFVDFARFLPGVFTHNPLDATVNGTLWSLRFELCCYALLYAAGRNGLLDRRRCWAFYAAAITIAILCRHSGTGGLIPHLLPSFVTGIALYVYRGEALATPRTVAALIVATILLRHQPIYPEMLRITIACGAIAIATARWRIGHLAERAGDCSYGLYLYGWPVEQTILHLMPGTSATTLILLAVPITTLLAMASWRLIEWPALRLKARRVDDPHPANSDVPRDGGEICGQFSH